MASTRGVSKALFATTRDDSICQCRSDRPAVHWHDPSATLSQVCGVKLQYNMITDTTWHLQEVLAEHCLQQHVLTVIKASGTMRDEVFKASDARIKQVSRPSFATVTEVFSALLQYIVIIDT